MSPASQGALQVERYIGTCLISRPGTPGTPPSPCPGGPPPPPPAAPRHANGYVRYPPGAWAGVPLIAVVQPRRNRNNINNNNKQPAQQLPPAPGPEGRSPLSRLAIHTQGAPLILAGRYPNNNNNRKQQQPPPRSQQPSPAAKQQHQQPAQPQGVQHPGVAGSAASSDSLSVASDESSGHSENSLPRIIKPRKRRKKDRKPPALGQPGSGPATPDIPQHPVPTVSLKTIGGKEHDGEATPDEPKLHHEFEEVKEHLDAGVERAPGLTLCQCRYCDPAGLIWDVDQNCYSPFLTPPQPLSLSQPLGYAAFQRSSLFPDLVLRRSWSEPSPSRKDSESSNDSHDSESSSLPGRRATSTSPPSPSHQALEVSSEIVTSHNGHRDIEIRFFSAPSVVPVGDLVHEAVK